jgi:hypothetical protein
MQPYIDEGKKQGNAADDGRQSLYYASPKTPEGLGTTQHTQWPQSPQGPETIEKYHD